MIEQKDKVRFWKKVDKKGKEDCWPWMANHKTRGYGGFHLSGKSELAHRISWVLNNGAIPEGACVCHHCDNPGCVNPDHLFLGTQKDNMQDASRKGRLAFTGGEANGNSKHTEEKVLEIRRDWKNMAKKNKAKLGRKHNISPVTIREIIIRKTWQHI